MGVCLCVCGILRCNLLLRFLNEIKISISIRNRKSSMVLLGFCPVESSFTPKKLGGNVRRTFWCWINVIRNSLTCFLKFPVEKKSWTNVLYVENSNLDVRFKFRNLYFLSKYRNRLPFILR